MSRVFNFSAGPGCLPEVVLEEARDNMLDLHGTGIGILEHSHRGKAFIAIHEETEARIRKVLSVPSDYSVLMLQGGATMQFSMVPLNLRGPDQTADYFVTGVWAQKAANEAGMLGKMNVAASSEDRNFCYIPREYKYSSDPAYVHYTSNNTIYGTQMRTEPVIPKSSTLVCDVSSDICSRPIDVTKYGLIYAGAQKNMGSAGVTIVIVRNDLLERAPKNLPTMMQYRVHAKDGSMHNTPPTFAIYLVGLVMKWVENQGGVEHFKNATEKKAAVLYNYLDQSKLFKGAAEKDSRSHMNVTFITGKEVLDDKFCKEATAAGFDGLKGHRSVGGMRASIYNSFPMAGVEQLVQFMKEFESKNS